MNMDITEVMNGMNFAGSGWHSAGQPFWKWYCTFRSVRGREFLD